MAKGIFENIGKGVSGVGKAAGDVLQGAGEFFYRGSGGYDIGQQRLFRELEILREKLNMPLSRTLRLYSKIKLKMPSPMFVAWDITYKCNLNCFFCDRQTIYRDKLNKDLTLSEAKMVIDNLADADVMTVGITGGEALLRNDLEDIAEYAVDKGLVVTLSTNGTLMTKSRAQKLVNLFQSISISLDGLSDTHDEVRGKKGAYAGTIRGLKYLAATNPRACAIGVNFVLNKLNFQEPRKVFDTIKNIGVDYFLSSRSLVPVLG